MYVCVCLYDNGPEAETWPKYSEKWLFYNVSWEECMKLQ